MSTYSCSEKKSISAVGSAFGRLEMIERVPVQWEPSDEGMTSPSKPLMARIWGNGFTKTQSLKGIRNPGIYLTFYLSSMELEESIKAGTFQAKRLSESKDKSKAVVKGARLKLYPSGFNLYRFSHGVKRPEVWQTTEQEAQAEIAGMPLTYEKTISITDEGGTVRNIINYRTYTKGAEKNHTIAILRNSNKAEDVVK